MDLEWGLCLHHHHHYHRDLLHHYHRDYHHYDGYHHHHSYHQHNHHHHRRQPSNGWLWIWNEDCAYIKTNEKWNDYSCTKKKMWGWTINALCEKPIKRQPTTTKPPEINVGYEPYEPTGNEPIAIKPTANKGDYQKSPAGKGQTCPGPHIQFDWPTG